MVQSIFIRLGEGEKVTAILCRWSSRGMGTPEVKIASVSVPAFTGNKMASSNLEGEKLPDRPEPAQMARDRSLKKKTANTRPGGICREKSPIT